jgi:ribosome biogenesis GTPase
LSDPLQAYGWDAHFAALFEEAVAGDSDSTVAGLEPGRVCRQLRGVYRVWSRDGEVDAVSKSSLGRRECGYPVIGDWVAFAPPTSGSEQGRIDVVLRRRTKISRVAAGERSDEQVVAANVDVVFVVMGHDGDYNLRRLERFLVMVGESGAEPVVVLNKSDLAESGEQQVADAQSVAPGVSVVSLSSGAREGLSQLSRWLRAGRTIALLGSSGVGKSTLVNALAQQDLARTGEVREGDDRGRHTTSFRQLMRLPSGALLVDNPGVREVLPWAERGSPGREDLAAFADLEELTAGCRFRDCGHVNEPGCEVLAAIQDGRLDVDRLASYKALRDELRKADERRQERERAEESRRSARPAKGRGGQWRPR